MSEQLPLGKVINDPKYHAGYRDAIHVAVVPVTAAERLRPGDHVDAAGGTEGKPVGIVDPFLTAPVRKGERFWLFLYPGTIRSLRHHWQHDAFPEAGAGPPPVAANPSPPDRAASVAWLTEFAKDFRMSYDDLLTAAREEGQTGGYYTLDFTTPGKVYDEDVMREFWLHFQIATGEQPGEGNFFTCSC